MTIEKDHEPDLALPDVELAGHVATSAPARMTKWGLLFVALVLFVMHMPFSNIDISQPYHGLLKHVLHPVVNSRLKHQEGVHWEEVPVSAPSDLKWAKCYANRLCARMAVPLDYTAIDDGREAIIALVKLPANVSPSSPAYRGPILVNPGGPGGSGVQLVYMLGDAFQSLIGEEFDIIGFDPRGVGASTPGVNVFPNQAEGTAFRLRVSEDPLLNISADAMARVHSRFTIYNKLAELRTTHASLYVSTAAVARDMLAIVKAHGSDKLQYWGFSYGSILGATFAAMFPDNVGRLIVDAIVDPDDYYGALWSNNLVDTDASLHKFFEGCVEAGPSRCALYEPTAGQVKARLDALFEKLKSRPIAVPATSRCSSLGYGLVDYALVRRIVFAFLYSPYSPLSPAPFVANWLSNWLAEVEKGNGEPLWKVLEPAQEHFVCQCPGLDPPSSNALDITLAIACGDGEKVKDTVEDIERHQARIAEDSSFAELWTIRAYCINRNIRPKDRFTGPLEGNTSHPLLIIGNTADPVTPLRNAHKMAKGFTNSVVLTQNSAGHASVAATSYCTAKTIRDYFREGTLPPPGTVCEISSKMFGGEPELPLGLDWRQQNLLYDWGRLGSAHRIPGFGLFSHVIRLPNLVR